MQRSSSVPSGGSPQASEKTCEEYVEAWKNSSPSIVGLSGDFRDNIYVSDSPRSLRKRYYTSNAGVSEHICPVTCLCLKCQRLAAQGPSTGPYIPGAKHGSHSTDRHISTSFSVNLSKPRDFAWLLARVAEPTRRISQTLRLNIPETVILEKGKPKKMYFLDADGQLNMTRMKTSAELLRVLKNFIKLCVKREARAVREAEKPAAEYTKRRASNGPSCVPRVKQTVVASNAFENAFIAENKLAVTGGEWDRLKSGAAPLEVAVLHYNDGAVRTMTDLEAQQQMQGRNKLPKTFWGDIAMLQSTVQSSKKGSSTKYITYSFDLRSSDQKAALDDWQHRNAPNHQKTDNSATVAVEAVPKIINEYLRKKVNLEMVSGQLEFMEDEADNTLWLINASRLVCAKTTTKSREEHKEQVSMEIKYFCEDEFSKTMDEHEQFVDKLQEAYDKEKKRLELAQTAKGPAELFRSSSFFVNDPDKLQLPPTLQTLTSMKSEMNRYYKEKVKYESGRKQSNDLGDNRLATGTHNIPLLFETSLGDLKRTFSGSNLAPTRSSSEAQPGSRVPSAGQRSELRICRVPEKSKQTAPPPRLSRPQSASSHTHSQSDVTLLGEDATPLSSRQGSHLGSRPGSRPPSRQASRPPSRQMTTRPLRSQSEAFPAAQYPRSGSLI